MRRWKSLTRARLLPLLMLAVLAQAGGTARSAGGADAAAPYDPDAVLVAFRPAAALQARLTAVRRLGLTVDTRLPSAYFAKLRLGALRARGVTVQSAIDQLRRDPSVRIVQPDYLVRAESLPKIPNDKMFKQQWALNNTGQTGGTPDADIDMPEAWRAGQSTNAIVAVVDSGVDYNHPDLAANILRDGSGKVVGFDFLDGDADPMASTEPHGTLVAGIIGAVGNNKEGLAGAAWSARLMPIRFIAGDGTGETSAGIQGIDFAVTHGARVINNSWGNYNGLTTNRLLLEAIQRAEAADVLVVCSAGNDNRNTDDAANVHLPSGYNQTVSNLISVGGTDARDAPATTNFGAASVDLFAPGEGILGPLPAAAPLGPYGFGTGTSGAAALVSGVAALIRGLEPTLTPAEVRTRILNNVDVIGGLAGKCVTSGRLNANLALFNGNPPSGSYSAKPTVKFPATKVGSAAKPRPLVIFNRSASEPLTVTVGNLVSPFTVVSGGGVTTLSPKGKLSVKIDFSPTAKGSSTQTLGITTSDDARPNPTVKILGKGK